MKYSKTTKVWSVKAETEEEAVRLIDSDSQEYLESESVTRTEYKKYKQDTGWAAGIRNQLIGGNGTR